MSRRGRVARFIRPNGGTSTYWLDANEWEYKDAAIPMEVSDAEEDQEYDNDEEWVMEGRASSSRGKQKKKKVPVIVLKLPSRRCNGVLRHQACADFSQSVAYPHGGGGSRSSFVQDVQRILLDPTASATRRQTRVK